MSEEKQKKKTTENKKVYEERKGDKNAEK